MCQLFLVIISFCLTIGSVHAAAYSGDIQLLTPRREPLPYRADLSDTEMLRRSEQYVSDIAQMAMVMELAESIDKERTASGCSFTPPSLHIRCLVSHPKVAEYLSRHCSSNMADFFNKRAQSSEEHPAPDIYLALAKLFEKCKATWDATPVEQRKTWLLTECTQFTCPATRTSYPEVRATFEDKFIKMVQKKTKSKSVYAAIGSGLLAQDLRLLQLCAERGITDVKTVVIIDPLYDTIVRQFPEAAKKGAIEPRPNQPLHERFQYPEIFTNTYFRELALLNGDERMQQLQSGDLSILESMRPTIMPALETAFVNTLHLFVMTRAVDQFMDAALKAQPKLTRLYVSASVGWYMKSCNGRPALRADMLTCCDAKHKLLLKEKTECSDWWQKLWADFFISKMRITTYGSVSCLLATTARDQACLQLYTTKESETWRFQDGSWKKYIKAQVPAKLHNEAVPQRPRLPGRTK